MQGGNKPIFPGLPRPLLFGHRGARTNAPENTWEAFDLALCQGANVLEMDVHLSKDGEVVVIHDPTLERTTNGQGLVREHTWKELAALDAGYRFELGRGDFRFRDRGVRLSRLSEVLENFAKAAFNIEIKQRNPPIISAVLQVLEAQGPANVLLTAGDDVIMAALEAARPGVALGLSSSQCRSVLVGAYRGGIPEALHGRAFQVPPRYGPLPVTTARVIQAAHQANIEVHLWTINDPRAAATWLARGVDGLMSDDPGALAGAIMDARHAGHYSAPHSG